MRRRFLPGILVAMALAGCGETAPIVVSAPPILPVPPADFAKPVNVPVPKVGEDARVYAAQVKVGLLKANRRLANDSAFYADVAKLGAH